MASLVADYSSSENDSSDDSDDSYSRLSCVETTSSKNLDDELNTSDKLPLPDFATSSNAQLNTSVFSNPFSEAERAKKAILEKHVKMTPTRDDTKMINGKKICWNFRKGRCRFGHKCKFAHDSDLHCSEMHSSSEDQEVNVEDFVCLNQINSTDENIDNKMDGEDLQLQKKGRKRPGLSQGLIPGKKVMKMYKKQSKNSLLSLNDNR